MGNVAAACDSTRNDAEIETREQPPFHDSVEPNEKKYFSTTLGCAPPAIDGRQNSPELVFAPETVDQKSMWKVHSAGRHSTGPPLPNNPVKIPLTKKSEQAPHVSRSTESRSPLYSIGLVEGDTERGAYLGEMSLIVEETSQKGKQQNWKNSEERQHSGCDHLDTARVNYQNHYCGNSYDNSSTDVCAQLTPRFRRNSDEIELVLHDDYSSKAEKNQRKLGSISWSLGTSLGSKRISHSDESRGLVRESPQQCRDLSRDRDLGPSNGSFADAAPRIDKNSFSVGTRGSARQQLPAMLSTHPRSAFAGRSHGPIGEMVVIAKNSGSDATTVDGSSSDVFPRSPGYLSDTDEVSAMTDMAHDGDDESTIIRRRDGLRVTNSAAMENFLRNVSPRSTTNSLSIGVSRAGYPTDAQLFNIIDADVEFQRQQTESEDYSSCYKPPRTDIVVKRHHVASVDNNLNLPPTDNLMEDNSVRSDHCDDSVNLRHHAYTVENMYGSAESRNVVQDEGPDIDRVSQKMQDFSDTVDIGEIVHEGISPLPSISMKDVSCDLHRQNDRDNTEATPKDNALQPRNGRSTNGSGGNDEEQNITLPKNELGGGKGKETLTLPLQENSTSLYSDQNCEHGDEIRPHDLIVSGIVGENVETNPQRFVSNETAMQIELDSVCNSVIGHVVVGADVGPQGMIKTADTLDSHFDSKSIVTVKATDVSSSSKIPFVVHGSEVKDSSSVNIVKVCGIMTDATIETNSIRSCSPSSFVVPGRSFQMTTMQENDSVASRNSRQHAILSALQSRPSGSSSLIAEKSGEQSRNMKVGDDGATITRVLADGVEKTELNVKDDQHEHNHSVVIVDEHSKPNAWVDENKETESSVRVFDELNPLHSKPESGEVIRSILTAVDALYRDLKWSDIKQNSTTGGSLLSVDDKASILTKETRLEPGGSKTPAPGLLSELRYSNPYTKNKDDNVHIEENPRYVVVNEQKSTVECKPDSPAITGPGKNNEVRKPDVTNTAISKGLQATDITSLVHCEEGTNIIPFEAVTKHVGGTAFVYEAATRLEKGDELSKADLTSDIHCDGPESSDGPRFENENVVVLSSSQQAGDNVTHKTVVVQCDQDQRHLDVQVGDRVLNSDQQKTIEDVPRFENENNVELSSSQQAGDSDTRKIVVAQCDQDQRHLEVQGILVLNTDQHITVDDVPRFENENFVELSSSQQAGSKASHKIVVVQCDQDQRHLEVHSSDIVLTTDQQRTIDDDSRFVTENNDVLSSTGSLQAGGTGTHEIVVELCDQRRLEVQGSDLVLNSIHQQITIDDVPRFENEDKVALSSSLQAGDNVTHKFVTAQYEQRQQDVQVSDIVLNSDQKKTIDCSSAGSLNDILPIKQPSSPAARALEHVTSADDAVKRNASDYFEGIDINFVAQYEATFNAFLAKNPHFAKQNREFVEFLRVAKLQKILAVTADVEAELLDYVASLEVQKKTTTTRYHSKLLEAAKKKAAREIQLQQELNTIQQATQLMESKLTWQMVSKSESRAKKYVQILENLESSKRMNPKNPLETMPDTMETRSIIDAVQAPSGVGRSNQLTDEQIKDLRQFQVDNAFLNAEAVILERKLLYVQNAAKKYAWVDSVFRRMSTKQHKMLKHRYHHAKNDDKQMKEYDENW